MCTRPPHFHTLYKGKDSFETDGVLLHDGPELIDEVYKYLTIPTPLKACLHCYGGNADTVPHRQLRKYEIDETQEAFR